MKLTREEVIKLVGEELVKKVEEIKSSLLALNLKMKKDLRAIKITKI